MRFIELNLVGSEGARFSTSVAVSHIVSVTATQDDRCVLRLTNGEEVRVSESYDLVAGLLMDSGATFISEKVTHQPPHSR